jgi:F0F1-type ATP synthase assembly protein I
MYARMARLSVIMTILPSSMAAGWIVGHYIVDRYLLAYPLGTLLMMFLGAGAGFYEIVRILMRDKGDAGSDTNRQRN